MVRIAKLRLGRNTSYSDRKSKKRSRTCSASKIVCVHGSCRVILDNGARQDELALSAADRGIHVPPMIWTTVVPDSTDTTVLVLASAEYDAADYIRDYDEFLRAAHERGSR